MYELTGPRLLTFAEAIGEIATTAGRRIRFVSITMEQYASLLAQGHIPPDFVWLLTYLFTEVLDGRNAHLTDGVQRAMGRQPRDFSQFVGETAATGVWGAADDQVGTDPCLVAFNAVRTTLGAARRRLRSRHRPAH